MTIKLNVLITLSKGGKTFSVWAEEAPDCPELELYEGHGHSLSGAVEDFFGNLPKTFFIDDETAFVSSKISYCIKRPVSVTAPRGFN